MTPCPPIPPQSWGVRTESDPLGSQRDPPGVRGSGVRDSHQPPRLAFTHATPERRRPRSWRVQAGLRSSCRRVSGFPIRCRRSKWARWSPTPSRTRRQTGRPRPGHPCSSPQLRGLAANGAIFRVVTRHADSRHTHFPRFIAPGSKGGGMMTAASITSTLGDGEVGRAGPLTALGSGIASARGMRLRFPRSSRRARGPARG
jgi:hypothetical protein